MLANLDLGALKGAAAAGAAKKNNKFNKGNKNKAKAKFNAARSGSADRSKSTEGQAPRATKQQRDKKIKEYREAHGLDLKTGQPRVYDPTATAAPVVP